VERRDVVLKLSKKGYLLSKDAVDYLLRFSDDIVCEIIDKLPDANGIKHLKISDIEKTVFRMNVRSSLIYIKRPIRLSRTKIDTLVKLANERFEKISKILLNKIDPESVTSINKIKNISSSFTIIGRVISKNLIENIIEIDDGTGVTKIKTTSLVPDEGEIIAIVCEKKNGEIVAKDIIYPDVRFNLKNTFPKSDMKIVVFSGSNVPKNIDFDVGFTLKGNELNDERVLFVSKKCDNDRRCVENFSVIEINDVKIQFILMDDHIKKEIEKYGSVENFIKRILKRRLILTSEKFLIGLGNDIYLIDNLPNILIIFSNKNVSFNYKSVMVVSLDILSENRGCFLIDMNEGKVIKCSK